ncbi:MAG: hypothetical protein IKK94_03860 [Clostridia bacterium]|nr:hypothetical protein [Clostridia bacterium]
MLVCNGDISLMCSTLRTYTVGDTICVNFDIFKPASPEDIKFLFADDAFYFHDEILGGRLPVTENKKIVGLRIVYSADPTYKITIKLK